MTTSPSLDLSAIKTRQQAAWASGDFGVSAAERGYFAGAFALL